MINPIVRLLEVNVRNIKNVECGTIRFNNYTTAKKEFKLMQGDILGIYGQNGSGKTAFIQGLEVLRLLLSGGELSEDMRALITSGQEVCTLETTFFIELDDDKYLAFYEVSISKAENRFHVTGEKLSYTILAGGKWKARSKLVDYSYIHKDFFKPVHRYREIVCKDKEANLMLKVAKELSRKNKTSFIFSTETKSVFNASLEESSENIRIIDCLVGFARFNLVVITNKQFGFISLCQLLQRSKADTSHLENCPINIFKPFTIPERLYKAFSHLIGQISIVLETIIPGLNLELYEHNRQYLNTGEIGVQVELLSVREGRRISLGNEAEGVKKIIWMLNAIISIYNQPSVCLTIDDMDTNIFEYLFGELLEIIQKGAKGQLIFTAHNLRALEKLRKESIVFATTNPNNRYVRLEQVKRNDNLRDFYLRTLALGGQKEEFCKDINIFEFPHKLRRVGDKGIKVGDKGI